MVRSDLAVVRAHGRRHLALGFPSDHVTGSPDMGNRGAQRAINPHGSRLVQLHTHLLQANILRIGAS